MNLAMEASNQALRALRLRYFDKKMRSTDGDTHATDTKEATAKAEKVAAKPTFLALPAEIRNMIYEYVLGGLILTPRWFPIIMYKMHPDSTPDGRYGSDDKRCDWDQHTAILRVSKQIYSETRLLPYSKNVFNTENYSLFGRWLDIAQKFKKDAITAVYVNEHKYAHLFRWIEHVWDRLENLQFIFCKMNAPDHKKLLIEEYVAKRSLMNGEKSVKVVYCKLNTEVRKPCFPVTQTQASSIS